MLGFQSKVFSASLVSIVLLGCGGGGGGGGGGADEGSIKRDINAQTPIVSGTWEFRGTETSNCEGESGGSDTQIWMFSQSGTLVECLSEECHYHSGNLTGNFIDTKVKYQEDGGETSESITLIFDAASGKASFRSDWSWTDGDEACTGTTVATGECLSGGCLNGVSDEDS